MDKKGSPGKGAPPKKARTDASRERSPPKNVAGPSQIPGQSKRGQRPLGEPQASPPQLVNIEELMKAASGLSDMKLVHEIAVDNDFKIESVAPPPNSLTHQVQTMMHKAFWDILREKLSNNPPEYEHALSLLAEVKEKLLGLLLPRHVNLRKKIEEVLDINLIKQKLEREALDFKYYADFIITLMAQLCAPVRDTNIEHLKSLTDPIDIFREILEVLKLMSMDMANFTIQQMRPFIQQQSVEYEKKKFKIYLEQQAEHKVDGLLMTKNWISQTYSQLKQDTKASSAITPAALVNSAFVALLDWDIAQAMPETLIVDRERWLALGAGTRRLAVISAVLLIAQSSAPSALSGLEPFKKQLKDNVLAILADKNTKSELDSAMTAVAEQVLVDVRKTLKERGLPTLDKEKETLLKSQVSKASSMEEQVHKLTTSRLHQFFLDIVSSSNPSRLQVPQGMTAMTEELMNLAGRFMRLVGYNKAVFGEYYTNIVSEILGGRSPASKAGKSPKK